MSFSVSTRIPRSHPALPGHFPGHPIVPGVVLLEEVTAALRIWKGVDAVAGLPTVKFLHPLTPETEITIALEEGGENRIRFECRAEGTLVAQGQITLRDPGEAP